MDSSKVGVETDSVPPIPSLPPAPYPVAYSFRIKNKLQFYVLKNIHYGYREEFLMNVY